MLHSDALNLLMLRSDRDYFQASLIYTQLFSDSTQVHSAYYKASRRNNINPTLRLHSDSLRLLSEFTEESPHFSRASSKFFLCLVLSD